MSSFFDFERRACRILSHSLPIPFVQLPLRVSFGKFLPDWNYRLPGFRPSSATSCPRTCHGSDNTPSSSIASFSEREFFR